MEIRQLRHFLAVAEARNFRLAAERVNLSQQAVSKSILQLERSLSISLFERGRQAVLLTEEGRQLLAYARDILADVRRFDDALADTMGRKHGHLRIGATPNLLSEAIPDTLRIFHERYPEARLSVDRGDFPLLRDTMLQGDLDLILCSSPEQIPGISLPPASSPATATWWLCARIILSHRRTPSPRQCLRTIPCWRSTITRAARAI
ncbi:LysR family transcriptional regulator [Novosphingobium resinovorum]